MRESDVLCLPSFTEGSPNVVKEAMASGLAVIASRVGGVPDLVRDGYTGLLFEPGNVDELRTCVRALCNDVELRRNMGKAGHDFMRESGMNWDSTAEEFDRLFASMVPGDPPVSHLG
jgi:glycosyltransferase involved in cell wall biosynthesis